MNRLFGLLLALSLPGLAGAQISHGGTPPSLDPALAGWLIEAAPVAVMPPVDVAALLDEDRANAGRKDLPWRFGANIRVQLGLEGDGRWDTLPGGDRVWRLGIVSPGAVSLNLAFDRFDLPPGGELYVRSADGAVVLGAFTAANHKRDGRFATTLVAGDELVLEYLEPADAPFPGELQILNVTHGYRGPEDLTKALNDSGACNVNVHCSPLADGWEDPVRATVMLVSGNNGFCSGVLLNNTAQDGTPYLLTANHCYSNPSFWVIWFNWEAAGCDNPIASPPYDSLTGATLVARDNDSDFALLELSSTPPPSYGVFLAGWDAGGVIPSAATSIHHPSGDVKKITFEGNQISPNGEFWEVGPWDDGTTEGGSSGGPLFDENQRVVGQLFGGQAACQGSNPNNGTDVYGRFDRSWDAPQPDDRLRDWLDPGATGIDELDGLDPNAPVAEHDAGILSILAPVNGASLCDGEVAVEVTLKNYGSAPLEAVDIELRVDGGPWSATGWSGQLASGATEDVALPALTLADGEHTLEVSVSAPNGEADGNAANDARTSTFEVASGAGLATPFVEGFDAAAFPPDGWVVDNPDGEEAWQRTTAASAFDSGSGAAWFDNFDEEHVYEADTLHTPRIDLTTAPAPVVLEFDLAYARYDGDYWDQLQVQVSADCGATWDLLWDKASTELATTGDVEGEFVPDFDEWRTETVDLSAYAGADALQIAFVNISGWGNHLYVDNVLVHGGPTADDADGDGYTVDAGDCDDTDAATHPHSAELCDDGVDNDCDGDVDQDDAECETGDDDDDTADDDHTGDDDTGDDDTGDDDTGDDDTDAGDDDTPPKLTVNGACACRVVGADAATGLDPGVLFGGTGALVGLWAIRRRRG